METEYDFIRYLAITDNIDELITDFKDSIASDQNTIQLSNGHVVKIKNIIHDVEEYQKSGYSFVAIMAELISEYCPMLEDYML